MEQGDYRIRQLLASVASCVGQRAEAVTKDIQDVIERAIPGLRTDDTAELLRASIGQNIDVAVDMLTESTWPGTVTAPPAAVEYARRLAQQDVPATALVRTYRVGQARFVRLCIEELLRQSPGEHLEGLATMEMTEAVSDYIDQVVEQVLTSYAESRDAWLRDRSAMLAMRVRELLRAERVDVVATEGALDYRLDQHHVGLVLWSDASDEPEPLSRLRKVVRTVAQDLDCSSPALTVPADEHTLWSWVPAKASVARSQELATALKAEPAVAVAVGEPIRGVDGFRRTHRQATSARAVALAAGKQRRAITPFIDVAPIAMLCSDLDSARAWIHETLGDLAIDTTRNEGLRETARVFLQTGGSYTAAAEQLFLHRNTAQYRVRKAEEVRGRTLRDGRLDVELALLACHWLKTAVLQPSRPA